MKKFPASASLLVVLGSDYGLLAYLGSDEIIVEGIDVRCHSDGDINIAPQHCPLSVVSILDIARACHAPATPCGR